VLIKKAPGGDAIDRLKTLDAKIHAARQGIKEHEAKEKMVCRAPAILACNFSTPHIVLHCPLSFFLQHLCTCAYLRAYEYLCKF
jgi:hypothetical protein